MADLSNKMIAMCKLIATDSLAMGYNVPDRRDLEVKARVWIEVLDRGNVPAERYLDLYRRASDARIKAMQDGKNTNLSAELMLSLWEGPNGMRAQLSAGTPKPMLGAAVCTRCHGSGFEPFIPPDGRHPGVRRCRHD